ncbi:hypothetical protein FJZ55_00020 [Candidatus Woesearchaeota archaeon]|nr:hypothetical protein [Candidatus Woesearchaeota archaeon]
MVNIKNIILDTSLEKLENLLSPFIQEQFPAFIRSDYPKLVLFIKAYYEWLETQNNPGYVLSKLDSIGDIDKNTEEFYSHFKNTYLESFPDLLATNISGNKPNKKTLLKKIRDFYGNKGTESAYKFLFRVLYDSDLDIYYPKEDVLKISDGNWVEPKSIKISSLNGTDLFSVKNGEISQYEDTTLVASAFIEDVVQYVFNGINITEVFIRDIVGNFRNTKPVVLRKESTLYQETPFSVLGEFFIELPGRGYKVGDTVIVQDLTGVGFAAQIEQIGLAGTIKKIAISNSGINYPVSIVANIISDGGQQTAKIILVSSAITKYPGYFLGNRGKISSNKHIQDGNYYQDFSYELKSEISFNQYFDVLNTIIHPSGTRMFGSVLVKKELQNQSSSSSQGTFIEKPLIGQYTPYTFNTSINLRKNGNESAGYWLGVTGDLYPLGYNPYIGSTTEVGPNGSTTPNGTVFVGSSLGYTWCYVPENGITSHNPIGAALGSTSAWYLNRESNLDPADIDGLVLWLKPENIGVCGSVVNGASVDVWRDASPSGNDALPPTWDRWNNTLTTTYTGPAVSEWSKQVYQNPEISTPITRLQFAFNGVCGGFTTGRLMMVGLNTDPNTNASYASIDYAFYSYGPNGANPTQERRIIAYESGASKGDMETPAGPNYSAFDTSVFEIEYKEPDIIYRINGVQKRRVYSGYGKTYYMDSSFYGDGNSTRIGHSLTVLGMWNGDTPVRPSAASITTTSGLTTVVYSGVTVDKLRPTLQTAGYGGATGVSFNGGVLYSARTTYAGKTLGGLMGLGYTTGPGSSAASILTAQHLYLKKPLNFSDEMDVFMVMKSTSDSPNNGMGLFSRLDSLSPSFSATGPIQDDSVLFNRSYNSVDRIAANQTSEFYSVTPRGTLLYPTRTGLVGFRPDGGLPNQQITTISYDPHVSGACMGLVIGEWTRDNTNRIKTYLNGDASLNRSRITGRRVVSVAAPSSELYSIASGLVFNFDPGKSDSVGGFASAKSANLLDLSPFRETPLNFIGPIAPSMWGGDGSPSAAVLVTQGSGAALGTDEVYEMTTGTSGNIYLNRDSGGGGAAAGAWVDSTTTSTTWTASFTIRRDDGAAISSVGVYIYTPGSLNSAPGTIEALSGGWYRVTRTKTLTTAAAANILIGLTGLGSQVKYRIGRVFLQPYPAATDVDIPGTTIRSSGSYPTGYSRVGTDTANEVGYKTGPSGRLETVWHGKNHSTINTVASFNSNVGFVPPQVSIDRTKLYRYSVWVNRAVLSNGNVYFGNGSAVLKRSDGSTDTNPYFDSAGAAESPYVGKPNQWVLVVGHIHPVGSGTGSNHSNSGYYLPNQGTTYAGLDASYGDKVWTSTSTTDSLRIFLYGSNNRGEEVQFARPRIEVVDGTEPSIEALTSSSINTVYDLSNSSANMEVINEVGYTADGGGAVVFTGGPGVISTNNSLVFGTNRNITWEAWVKPSVLYETDMYMGGGSLPYFGNYYTAFLWSVYYPGDTQILIKSNSGFFVANTWHHVVCVSEYDGTTTRYTVYKNGVKITTQATDGGSVIRSPDTSTIGISGKEQLGSSNDGNVVFCIANRVSGKRFTASGTDYAWQGSVSNTRVYSRALNPAEVQQNFNALRSRFGL